jgi:hypothetical protein
VSPKTIHSFAFVSALLCFALPTTASADEPLHEGFMVRAGTGTQGRNRLESSVDINLLPLPGGGRLNGTHIALSLGTDNAFDSVGLDRAYVALLRWPHMRLLGVKRNLDEGLPLGVELGGLSMPLALVGKKESRNWIIAHIGFDGNFNWYRERFTAVEDAMGLGLSLHARLDEQVDIFERLSLRAWQKACYSAIFGLFGDTPGLGVRQQVMLHGALGLYLDITREPLYRLIPRTDPVTGEVTYRKSVNQGPRWRWMIVNASGHWQPLGYVTGRDKLLFLTTGIERRF